jgi:tetratricopeptide (TPR) repeat protein
MIPAFSLTTGLLGLVLSAAFAGPDEEIDTIDAAASDVEARSASLVSRSNPGAYLSETEALTRFQDYLFLHMIGQNPPAAEGFFALVTTGVLVDAGVHRDAEWYLAESLAGMGNTETAATRFRLMVDEPGNPFHADAVRRLLEIYAGSGDAEAFRKLYDDEIVTGKVQTTGRITYSLAKSFHAQGDRGSARQYFQQVPADNEWYGRARYFLAVMDVEERKLDAAAAAFAQVAALSVQTPEDRKVHDLALLALGRIAYDQKNFTAAFEAYTSISGDSEYQDEKLYETIWTSIRREDWRDALNNVEIFLLGYPDHQYATQLRLLQGHLSFQQDLWVDALASYEQVIQDYEPVRKQFSALSADDAAGNAAVEAFLLAGAKDPNLPEYAIALMRSDPDLGRTLHAFTELDLQRQDIEASEEIIEELRVFILGSGAASSYDRLVMDGHYYRTRTLGLRLDLLDVETRWLGDATLAPKRAELVERWKRLDTIVAGGAAQIDDFEQLLAQMRVDIDNSRRVISECDRRIGELEPAIRIASPEAKPGLEAELAKTQVERGDALAVIDDANRQISLVVVPDVAAGMPAGDIAALGTEVDALERQLAGLRGSRAETPTSKRIDAAASVLSGTFARIGQALEAIQKNSQGELGAVRDRFELEVTNVANERADHLRTTAAARAVTLDVTRQGFGRLEDFFGDSVLRADMGIVDVYWAQKLDTDDALVAVREEKDATMAELDRRFALIREKLGEERGQK